MAEIRTKLYKYRDLGDMDRIADIFVKQRLFCARRDQLNDPLEGYFHAAVPQLDCRVVVNACDSKRVCSLSAAIENILQWTHYADGHKGVAIEFEPDGEIEPVRYSSTLFDPQVDTQGPVESLLYKSNDWEYEKEYRHITTSKWLYGKVVGVVFGIRTPSAAKELIQSYCGPLGAYCRDACLDATAYRVNIAKPAAES